MSGCDEAADGDDRPAVVFGMRELGVDVARVSLVRVVTFCLVEVRLAVLRVVAAWLVGADVDNDRRGADRVVVDARRTEESDVRLLRDDVTARRAVLDVVFDVDVDVDVDAADRRFGADSDAWVAT